ncbi:hypothetical protein NK8_83610 (plasmid) [Caballeronia sp. NK8]|nr:hypothetical protein NK8_83610 [Caballeronia sp. NK8]
MPIRGFRRSLGTGKSLSFAAELKIGVFEHFLDAQAVLGDLVHELFARTFEIA